MEPTNSVEPSPPKQNSSAGVVIAVLVILIIIALIWWKNDASKKAADLNNQTAPAAQETPPPGIDNQQTVPGSSLPPEADTVVVKSFTVEGTPFAFSLKEIKVNQGDKVQITFVNKEGFHDWILDEFNAKTPRINAGQTATIEFTADKKGTFEYYCSVGQHRQQGMKGAFIVQ